MKTYRIIGQTNGYIAQRDILFKGKTRIVIEDGLTLRGAQKELLNMFNEDYETNFSNWGLVRMNYPFNSSSFGNGLRSYDYDSRGYGIEEEE